MLATKVYVEKRNEAVERFNHPAVAHATHRGAKFNLDEPETALVQRILDIQSDKLHKQYDEVAKSENPKAVHQARVAVRRMRSAIYFFKPWLPGKAAKKLRRELGGLADCLGTVRDLDVSMIFVRVQAPALAPAAEKPLVAYLKNERIGAKRNLLEYYEGGDYKGLRCGIHPV